MLHTEETKRKMALAKIGNKNPRWNKGISEYQDHCELKRNRLKALESKNYICEHCEKTAKLTHHKNSNKADQSIENLLVLCHKCHKKLHGRYYRLYGMSLQEIANETKLSSPTICDYFNKKRKPHNKTENEMKKFIKKIGLSGKRKRGC